MANVMRNKAIHIAQEAVYELVAFSKLERILAAVCMSIPFLLILADSQSRIAVWSIVIGTVTIIVIPLAVAFAAYRINDTANRKNGILTFLITFVFTALLFFVWYLTLPNRFQIRESISSYVSMENAHLFGSLLTVASMLFIFNGAVYIHTVPQGARKAPGKWYNIILGICLLGVVLFPCTNPSLAVLHYGCAATFFVGSSIVIAFFNNTSHKSISLFIASVSILSFIVYFLGLPHLEWFTLFWSESIALWIIGIHYILESLGELI